MLTTAADRADDDERRTPVTYLSLCTGIGAMDLGLDRAGMTCAGQVELDPYCRRILNRHWPKVPKHDDVRTTIDWWGSAPRPRVDLVAAGFPCQPVSLTGRGLAQSDPRWVWDAVRDIVEWLRPEWVLWENVPGLRTRGLDLVHADLTGLDYTHTVGIASACSVGATHVRRRLLGVAHSPRHRRRARRPGGLARPAPFGCHLPPQGVDPQQALAVGLTVFPPDSPGIPDDARRVHHAVTPGAHRHAELLPQLTIVRAGDPPGPVGLAAGETPSPDAATPVHVVLTRMTPDMTSHLDEAIGAHPAPAGDGGLVPTVHVRVEAFGVHPREHRGAGPWERVTVDRVRIVSFVVDDNGVGGMVGVSDPHPLWPARDRFLWSWADCEALGTPS